MDADRNAQRQQQELERKQEAIRLRKRDQLHSQRVEEGKRRQELANEVFHTHSRTKRLSGKETCARSYRLLYDACSCVSMVRVV